MSKTILVIDDTAVFRLYIREVLESQGHVVMEAENGSVALKMLDEISVDLVITDILMPEMEGNEVAMYIRIHHPHLKVVGMTGGGQLGSPSEVGELCIPGYFYSIIYKPVLTEKFLRVVDSALSDQVVSEKPRYKRKRFRNVH
ncbi:MAG: response regulator [Planctomycetes bacterium]|nr:response regulator [Planctomycetota bacterium]